MRKKSRKLQLNRETLATLDPTSKVRGGTGTDLIQSIVLCPASFPLCGPNHPAGTSNYLSTCVILCTQNLCDG